MKIQILTTGGTIDKDYPHTQKGWAFEIGEPAIAEILNQLNPSFSYDIISICKKDSLEILEKERKKILDTIEESLSANIIITHGTDTMIETGQFLQKHHLKKTIVITGAMRPAKFKDSDALLNIGAAIALAQSLDHGVYITMHGIFGSADKITRDVKNGKFIFK